MYLLFVAYFVIGLVVGSFLNVCIYRLPEGKSIVSPPSACGNCGHRLGVLDMIPVLSYFLLGGKCRYCSMPYSPRYALVELLTACLFALCGFYYLPGITLALVFVSILISFKRKYRPTKVMVQKQNLSMQYAKSLSRLFFVESDYYNMVVKIKENFYHYVQKHFYLNPSDPDFVRLLAKRTGASVTLIQSIISLSEVTKNQKLDEHYFMELYQKTEQFKKKHGSACNRRRKRKIYVRQNKH